MKLRGLTGVVILVVHGGCASYTSVPLREEALADRIDVGDTVRVRTREGVTSEFEVTEVNALAIAGAHGRAELGDLVYVGVRSHRRAGLIALGVIGGLLILDEAFCSDPAPSASPSDC